MVFVKESVGVPRGTVTGTVTVHVPGGAGGEALAGIVPPVNVTVVVVVETVPPQVVAAGPATSRGVGRLSVKVAPV
jgi:hypothetical protein